MVGGNMSQELYPIDAKAIDVSFNGRPSGNPIIISHRLRRPTMAELSEREKSSSISFMEVGKDEQILTDEESANARLWDQIIVEVSGYDNDQSWRTLTPEEKTKIRTSHKSIAIRAMYLAETTIDGADTDSISLTAGNWTVKHAIGSDPENPAYVLYHVLREPTESERSKYKRTAVKTSFSRGSKKVTTKITQDLGAFVDLYDNLIQEIRGGSVDGMQWNDFSRNQFLMALDPLWKKMVIQTLMSNIEAALLD